MIPLNLHIYERGAGGVPSSTFLVDLQKDVISYQHTITDRFGFESCQISFKATNSQALDWIQSGLMRRIEVYSPDALLCWDGFLNQINVQVGTKQASISLDKMSNRVRCTYTTVLGTPGTVASSSDAGSQALYGVKDRVVPLNQTTATAAAALQTVVIADVAYPKSTEPTTAVTGEQGDITVTLSFVGWYATLGWPVTSNSTTSAAVTTTQVGTLLTTASAVNAFIDTSTTYIVASGISDTQFIAANTTIREKIEALLSQGDGTYPLTWGVYESQRFYVVAWAGATPTTITYQEFVGDNHIYNLARAVVEPWDVRPNAMSQVVELLDVGPVSGVPDSASIKYVGRVTCSMSGDQVGCTLEPPSYAGIDAILAAMVRG